VLKKTLRLTKAASTTRSGETRCHARLDVADKQVIALDLCTSNLPNLRRRTRSGRIES